MEDRTERYARALAVLRIALGVFFLAEASGKLGWFANPTLPGQNFAAWQRTAPAISQWYLAHVAVPGTTIFARLVPIGETCCGLALLLGFVPRVAATAAIFMALNFHFASGLLFSINVLSNGYGLPLLAALSTIALAGFDLPWGLGRGLGTKR